MSRAFPRPVLGPPDAGTVPRERGMSLAVRLLRQPHGFEGLGLVEVGPSALDSPLAHLEHLEQGYVDGHADIAPASADAERDDNRVTGVYELLGS